MKRIIALFLLTASLPLLCGCIRPAGNGSQDPSGSSPDVTPDDSPSLKPDTPSAPEDPSAPRKTPIMGWASWNAYRTDITEEIILSQARKLKELGLADLGYVFVNVDDGWQYGRGDDGFVNTNETKFPSGMKDLSDTIHALGLKAGIYTDAGALTCGWISDNQTTNNNVGLLGHDYADLNRYLAEWGYDFIKVDWCGGSSLGLSKQDRYTTIGKVVNRIEKETGRDKIYNVCCWSFPGEWVVNVADSWRTGGDIFNNFGAVLEQLDNIRSLAKYNGPGHVNDLDMMQIGNGMSYEEDKSHFAMWCMMSTPLMLGMDLNSISKETLSIISNAELIALDQDPACIQATPVKSYGNVEAWTKDLGSAGSGTKAIALLNRGDRPETVTVYFGDLGLDGVTSVRDLWSHTDISVSGSIRVTLPAHGTAVYKASGEPVPVSVSDRIATEDDGSQVTSTCDVGDKPKRFDLSSDGLYDWAHFGNATTRMKDGAGELEVFYEGSYVTYGNAACSYLWNNGDGAARSTGDTSGIGVIGDHAYMAVCTPCDGNLRTLKVAVGSYSADMTVELIVGGKTLFTKRISGGNATKADRLVTATYKSDIPTTAFLKVSVTRTLGGSQSVNIEGVTLNVEVNESAIGTIEKDIFKGKLTLTVPTLCAEDGVMLAAEAEGAAVRQTANVERGAGRTVLTLEPGGDYAGEISVYLQKDGKVIGEKKTFRVNMASAEELSIGMMTAKALVKEGAVLLDVRSKEEYDAGHIDGAINLDYSKVATEGGALLPDKNAKIVVYCSAAKRSAQAAAELVRMGYTAVFNLGSMQNYYAEPTLSFAGSDCLVITAGEKLKVSYTASSYDTPEPYISVGENSTLASAVKASDFRVPDSDCYYMTLKAYLVYKGVCYAQTSQRFLYWSEKTASAFATDLKWTEATIGWGSIRKNRSVDGHTLTLAGKTFKHGIGTHANSNIRMDIPEGAKKFLAVAGCDEEMSGAYTMMFFVYIDGKLVDNSSLIKCGQHYIFDVDVPEGAKEILLYAYEGTYGGNTCDHADWAVAAFFNDAKEL